MLNYRNAKIQINEKKNNTIAMGKVESQAFKVEIHFKIYLTLKMMVWWFLQIQRN